MVQVVLDSRQKSQAGGEDAHREGRGAEARSTRGGSVEQRVDPRIQRVAGPRTGHHHGLADCSRGVHERPDQVVRHTLDRDGGAVSRYLLLDQVLPGERRQRRHKEDAHAEHLR